MQIIVKIKSVYGNELIYPVCEKAHLFAILAGTRTLTKHNLEAIKKLGYTVVVSSLPMFSDGRPSGAFV